MVQEEKGAKLAIENKSQRGRYTKLLRKNFGVTKRSKAWRWNRMVNNNFSERFVLDSSSNPHNDSVWVTAVAKISPAIYYRSRRKFAASLGFLLWYLIRGIDPKRWTIWCHSVANKPDQRKTKVKIFIDSHLYAKFTKEIGYILIDVKNVILKSWWWYYYHL